MELRNEQEYVIDIDLDLTDQFNFKDDIIRDIFLFSLFSLLVPLITEEKLNEPETRKFIDDAFKSGEIRTVGTDIDKLMPPTSRFGGGNRAAKKQTIIDKLKVFFERFFGV